MALKKSELYSSLWQSCDELRGGMDASQYKDYVLVLLFVKYVSDKYAGVPYAPITIPDGAGFQDMVALKGKPDTHHRRSIRLEGYDYSQAGAYFVTICAHNRECLFGEIVEMVGKQEMVLNEFGQVVQDEWVRSAEIRAEIALGEFVVMPNHFHAIVRIVNDRRGDRPVAQMPVATTIPGPQPKSIGALLAGFKSAVTKRINETRKSPSVPVWQRNYHEHIIRNDADDNRIAEYVTTNPQRWIEDRLHPDNFIVSESNVGENGKAGGNGNIVGATSRSPLRNVPRLGGCHE